MGAPIFHKELTEGRWQQLSVAEQMANIGAEVGRAAKWQGRDEKLFWGAVCRALELFYLTMQDPKWRKGARIRELCRVKEIFCDAVLGGREYKSSLQELERYFFPFMLAARREK